jgi:Flp pilus assembly protein TadG
VLGFNRKRLWRKVLAMLWSSRASQMVEFAVSLPLLVVFVVGIFDFGEAFNLKQKLNNVARESARFASSLPTNDLSDSGDPASIIAIRNLVSSSLRASRVNDCGLGSQTGTNASPTWTYTASGNGCAGTLTLKIERQYAFDETVTGATNTIKVVSTHVSLSYPYKWRFNRVITLVAPGAAYAGVTQIVTDAVVPNTY